MRQTLESLKKIYEDGDFDTLLVSEEILLQEELQKYANSQEQVVSIEHAQQQIASAHKALELLRTNPDGYKSLLDGIKDSDIQKDGTPIDKFRDFLRSHRTRLRNKLAANLSVPEKDILRVRKDIVNEMERQYKKMQREVLGLDQE